MANIPPMKLPPEATPWGREMQRILENLEKRYERTGVNTQAAQQTAGTAATAIAKANTAKALAARVPASPDNFTITQDAMWDSNGIARVTVVGTWDKVTTDERGVKIELRAYEMWWKPKGATAEWSRLTSTGALMYKKTNFTPQQDVLFKMRSVSVDGVYGQFTDPLTIDLLAPTISLEAPDDPILSQKLGVVSVKWNGKLGDSAILPAKFKSVFVLQSDTQNGLYVEVGQALLGAGVVTIANVPVGETVWYRLRAKDNRGNISGTSAAKSITVQGIGLGTLEADVKNAIDAAKDAADNAMDEAIKPLSDAKLDIDSLSIWPFKAQAIPSGSFGPGAIGGADIGNFAITAIKFNDNRHHIF